MEEQQEKIVRCRMISKCSCTAAYDKQKNIPYFKAVSLSKRLVAFLFSGCINRAAGVPYAKGKSHYVWPNARRVLVRGKRKLAGSLAILHF